MLDNIKQTIFPAAPKTYQELAETFTGDMNETQMWKFIQNIVTVYCLENGLTEHSPNILIDNSDKILSPKKANACYHHHTNSLIYDKACLKECVKNKNYIKIIAITFHELTHFYQNIQKKEQFKQVTDQDFVDSVLTKTPPILNTLHESDKQAQKLYYIWQYCIDAQKQGSFYLQYPYEVDARNQAIKDTQMFIDLIKDKLEPTKYKGFAFSAEKKQQELYDQKIFRINQYLKGNRHIESLKTKEKEYQHFFIQNAQSNIQTICQTLANDLPLICLDYKNEDKNSLQKQVDAALIQILNTIEPVMTDEQKASIADSVMKSDNLLAMIEIGNKANILDQKAIITKLTDKCITGGLLMFSTSVNKENDIQYLDALKKTEKDPQKLAEHMSRFIYTNRFRPTDTGIERNTDENMKYALDILNGDKEARQVFLTSCIEGSIENGQVFKETYRTLNIKSTHEEIAAFLTHEKSIGKDELQQSINQVQNGFKRQIEEFQKDKEQDPEIGDIINGLINDLHGKIKLLNQLYGQNKIQGIAQNVRNKINNFMER